MCNSNPLFLHVQSDNSAHMSWVRFGASLGLPGSLSRQAYEGDGERLMKVMGEGL